MRNIDNILYTRLYLITSNFNHHNLLGSVDSEKMSAATPSLSSGSRTTVLSSSKVQQEINNSKGYFIHDTVVDCDSNAAQSDFIFDSFASKKLSKHCLFPFQVFLEPRQNIFGKHFQTCVPLTKPDINRNFPSRSKTYCPIGLQVQKQTQLSFLDNRIGNGKNKYLEHFGVCSSKCTTHESLHGYAYRVRKDLPDGYEKRLRECQGKCEELEPKFQPSIKERGLYCRILNNKNEKRWGHCVCEAKGCYKEGSGNKLNGTIKAESSSSIPTIPTSSIPSIPNSQFPTLIGIAAGCAALLIVLVIFGIIFLKKTRKGCFKGRKNRKSASNKNTLGSIGMIEHPDVVQDSTINRQRYERTKMMRSLKCRNDSVEFDPNGILNDQISVINFVPKAEMARSKFKVGKVLGSGNFGTVFKGEAIGLLYPNSKTTVAIKTVSNTSNEDDINTLIAEMKVMSHLDQHCNLVNMLGTCISELEENGTIWLLLEFCEKGDMKKFLTDNREDFQKDAKKGKMVHNRLLLTWSYDIAKGMEYLTTKNVMHGDLAARNILIGSAKTFNGQVLVAKVADFGMSKQLYENSYYRKVERHHVPWKWMAVEFFEDGKFQKTSDVWSYGVTIWELFSLGKAPYGGQGYDEVVSRLHEGYRLECPDNVKEIKAWPAEEIYKGLSDKSFQLRWDKRSSFTEVASYLVTKLSDDEKRTYSHIETQNATQNAMLQNSKNRISSINDNKLVQNVNKRSSVR